jgi:hypothetical protein
MMNNNANAILSDVWPNHTANALERIYLMSQACGDDSGPYFMRTHGDCSEVGFRMDTVADFNGQLLAGTISSGTARKLVRDWARRHRLELMINWRNIEKGRPLNRIKPLE